MPESELKPFFLIGFMGSGKSTLGKRIARKTGRPFIDLDDLIVEAAGMPIAEYFNKFGEEKFRELERDTLYTLPLSSSPVIAAGGGTPCFFDNITWMNLQGITVYLKLPPPSLLNRLGQGGLNTRPLLAGKSEDELLEFIGQKLAEREPWYLKATHVVNAIGITPEKLLHHLEHSK